MGDRFLSPPRNRAGPDGGEARILRDRLAAFDDALDRAGDDGPYGSARMLVQVYSGGAIPTTTPAVFLTHPVLASGAETEGTAATLTVDSATTVPVVVLGQAPSVGDFLTAYAVGGRWVTELITRSSPPPNLGGCVLLTCSPCSIPRGDLTVAWTNTLTGNGSATMTYSALGQTWTATCVDNGQIFLLRCVGGAVVFSVEYFTAGGCPGGTAAGCGSNATAPQKLTTGTQTCSPFSLTFGVDATNCPGVFAKGDTTFVITGPNTSFGACPICVTLNLCGSTTVGTVTITNGMTTVATGTTSGSVPVILDIGSAGTYTITVTAPDHNTHTSTQAFMCGQAISINPGLAPGFVCPCGCKPFSTSSTLTLTIVDSSAMPQPFGNQTVTLTYGPDPVVLTGNQFVGTFVSPALGTVVVEFSVSCVLQFYYQPFGPGFYEQFCEMPATGFPPNTTYSCSPIDFFWQLGGAAACSSAATFEVTE